MITRDNIDFYAKYVKHFIADNNSNDTINDSESDDTKNDDASITSTKIKKSSKKIDKKSKHIFIVKMSPTATIVWLLLFIYFSNEFLYRVVGLAYPIYLVKSKKYKINSSNHIFIKYISLYAELDAISLVLTYVGLPVMLLKTLFTSVILYLLIHENHHTMNNIYENIRIYNMVIINFVNKIWLVLKKEYAITVKKYKKN